MAWYWWLGLLALVVVSVVVVAKLLGAITAWGGDRTNALDEATRFSAEAEAFRGSRTPDNATLDGKNRIAPPTQDGGGPPMI